MSEVKVERHTARRDVSRAGSVNRVRVVAFGVKVPEPPLQVALVASPPIEPANRAVVFVQIVWLGPAKTYGGSFTVRSALAEVSGGLHPRLLTMTR